MLEAREVADGGAYGLQLADEVVRNRGRTRRLGLDVGREMVKGQNIGSHHRQQENHV